MRVLLLWPSNPSAVLSDELSCCEPLPLEYVAGALSPDHEVVVFDERLDPPLATFAKSMSPNLIGVAIPYTSVVRSARRLAAEARNMWPGVPIAIGGHHPTMTGDWLEGFAVDYIIVGEGGPTFRYLADRIEARQQIEPRQDLVPFEKRTRNPGRHVVRSLDDLPAPNRSVVLRHQQKYFHSIYRPVALMRFSAGCPFECSFCSLWRMTDRKYITKTTSRVVEELASISVDNIYVVDDEAFIQPRRMAVLANAIVSQGIMKRYHMYLRTDTAIRNRPVIEAWRKIGLDSVLVGAEAIVDSELDDYQKGTVTNQTREAVQLFHSLGIKVRANFIIRPDFDEEAFKRLAEAVDELQIDLPSFSVLTPLPGTKLFEETHACFISDNPDLFDCYHTLLETRLPLERFYQSVADLLKAAAHRQNTDSTNSSMFYFSNSKAFERMLSAIRNGHRLNDDYWRTICHPWSDSKHRVNGEDNEHTDRSLNPISHVATEYHGAQRQPA